MIVGLKYTIMKSREDYSLKNILAQKYNVNIAICKILKSEKICD